MSFMFNPYPYDDYSAVNPVFWDGSQDANIVVGTTAVASCFSQKMLSHMNNKDKIVIGVDGYASADFEQFIRLVSRNLFQAGKNNIRLIPVSGVYKSEEKLDEQFLECLPLNIEEDPVLLYGKLFSGSEESFFDKEKLQELITNISGDDTEDIVIVYGNFAGTKLLRNHFDLFAYIDIIPKNVVLRLKTGKALNIGTSTLRTYRELMRRSYYVDFELSLRLRAELLKSDKISCYILQNEDSSLSLVEWDTLRNACKALVKRPFRCKPVYNEGVWGGHYIINARNLPKAMKNCAWVFDLIPSEVSIVLEINDRKIDIPFYTFIKLEAESVLGEQCITRFGEYFPIRFNYDDTMHSSGNMSIQVHPGEKYSKENFNELGTQDESYYVVAAGQDSKTYCGFKDDADSRQFISLIRQSEKNSEPVPYNDYVNSIDTKPGMQFMLPAGTIHASGRNQLVLETGSLTVGSYTFKLYDYVRKDIDGTIRPIHSFHGERVLDFERTDSWVRKNVFIPPLEVESGDGWREMLLGETDLVYFSPRRIEFTTTVKQNTNGRFHVLALVNGESVKVVSEKDKNSFFIMKYLDIVVVPALLGAYRIENLANHPVVVHKTLLK